MQQTFPVVKRAIMPQEYDRQLQPMRESTPLVSVCCITYNHEQYISQAIEGFLNQKTTFPIEIIIHDDASTDRTTDIIRDYEKRYPDLIIPIHQTENQYSKGIRISLNFVWPRARGKYIAVCDGDDYWIDPLKLQKQVDFLESHPDCVICFSDLQVIDGINPPYSFIPDGQNEISTLEDLLAHNFIPTCTVMYRNGLTKEFPEWYYRMKIGDWPLYVLTAQYGNIGYIKEVTSVYRRHPTGVFSGGGKVFRWKASLEAREAVNSHFKNRYQAILGDQIFSYSYKLAGIYQKMNDLENSKIYLAKCIRNINFSKKVLWKDLIILWFRVWAPWVFLPPRFIKRVVIGIKTKFVTTQPWRKKE